MVRDPADETHRKPRQLRNTPLNKYVRLTSLFITVWYAGVMYISWRRHCNDPKVLAEYNKLKQVTEDERSMLHDYVSSPLLRGPIEKLLERQRAKEAEAELKDTQANA